MCARVRRRSSLGLSSFVVDRSFVRWRVLGFLDFTLSDF